MKILVPIDGSEYSIKALKHGINLMKRIGHGSKTTTEKETNEIIY